jgi:uncharacterized membrane protein YbhN (UPF0104 family)
MTKRILVALVWIAIVASLVYYLITHTEELSNIRHISYTDLALISLLFIFAQYLNGIRTGLLLKKMGLSLGGKECFHLSNATTMANYLPLKGGSVASALYFKNRHDIPYSVFVSISMAGLIIQLFTIASASSVLVFLWREAFGSFFYGLLYMFLFILLASILLWVFLAALCTGDRPYFIRSERIRASLKNLRLILTDKRLLLKLLMLHFTAIIVMAVRFALAFRVLNYNAPFVLSFLSGQLKSLAMLVNITPAGLGVAELLAGVMTKITGGNVAIGVYAASVDRIISVLILLALGVTSFVYLNKRHLFDAGKGLLR